MLRLEGLTVFVRAAALGSFSVAAREAGFAPAQVSAAIKRLETQLNIRLFARSTRSLRLTPEGETWLPYATQMLETLQAGLQKIQAPEDEVRGTLQIAVPSDLGRNLLLSVFQDFRRLTHETCCHAGNRMVTINNLFYRFNFKLFGITLTAHGHLSLSHLKWL